MIRTCLHPNCPKEMSRGRDFCKRHYAQLTDDFRRRLNSANKKDPSVLGALRIEIEQWFRSRMIGPHEVVTCKGMGCGKDVVWMPRARGKPVLVEFEGVEADDEYFNAARHVSHFAACPNAGDFRR